MFKKEKKIKIGKEKFLFKVNSIRALFLYETMTGKNASDVVTTEDNVKMIFCVLKACNKDTFEYEYEDFLDLLEDGQHNILGQVQEFSEKK